VPYFQSAEEIYEYIGGVFRAAGEHPEVGPQLRAANVVLQLNYTEPSAVTTVKFTDDFSVIEGETDVVPDVKLFLSGDIADKYWRGDYNLAVGLAKGQVKAKGPVNKILKIVPLTKPLFAIYREKTAEKNAAASAL
jgi:hypothetical protein